MNSRLKNIALASTLLIVPMKSERAVQNVSKPFVRELPKIENFTDFVKEHDKKLHEVLYAPFENLQRLDSLRRLTVAKVPQPKKDLDVVKTKFVGHPEFLNLFLEGVLAGKGEQFCKAQEKYGINATFLVGIANNESAMGKSEYARNRNNIAGMRGANGYLKFESVDECIDKMAANLKAKYTDQGLNTIEKINKKYAESDEWANAIIRHMNPMYDASKIMVYDFAK